MSNSALANYLEAVQDAGYILSNEAEVTALVVERKEDFILVCQDEADLPEYTVARFLKGVYNDYTGVGEFEGTLSECLKFVSEMTTS